MTLEQMKQQILGTAPVLCDRPAWTLFGVSMAGWNLLASLIMAGCCIAALRHARDAWRRRRAERELPRGAA
jgi:disulfide bond formation protein DsbB